MRAQWHALHADLVRTSTRLSFQTDVRAMRDRQEALRGIVDPAGLLERLHAPAQDDGDARNAILRALVTEAQQEDRAQTAVILLFLALWPGLDAVYRRLLRHFRSEPELLVAEISERVTRGVKGMVLGRVTWVAATLVRNTERDIRRSLAGRWREEELRGELREKDRIAVPAEPSAWLFATPADADQATAAIEVCLRDLVGSDAGLVTAVAIEGEAQNEAALRLGVSHEAARKRYQRALGRLRGHLENENGPLSQEGRGTGLSALRASKRSALNPAGALP